MKTWGRPRFSSSLISRSLKTQMKQITFSRGNRDVQSVTPERNAAGQMFASKHTWIMGLGLVPVPLP